MTVKEKQEEILTHKHVFDSTSKAFMATDHDGTVLLMKLRAAKILGVKISDDKGPGIATLFPEIDAYWLYFFENVPQTDLLWPK